jgi:peroxiredoxin Q/BCP
MTALRRASTLAIATIALTAALANGGCQTQRVATAGSLPAVGQDAPSFELVSNEGVSVSLDAIRGKWLVLYFYPKDFSSGCTLEAQNFQRDLGAYERAGAMVVGVSVDSAASHKEFCAKERLSFRLLADTDGSVSARYGSLNERNGRRLSARNTFIIDPSGKVAAVFTGVDPATHSHDVLERLREISR